MVIPLIQTSMLKQEGIDQLELQQYEIYSLASDMTYVSNSRHISLLKQARNAIQD